MYGAEPQLTFHLEATTWHSSVLTSLALLQPCRFHNAVLLSSTDRLAPYRSILVHMCFLVPFLMERRAVPRPRAMPVLGLYRVTSPHLSSLLHVSFRRTGLAYSAPLRRFLLRACPHRFPFGRVNYILRPAHAEKRCGAENVPSAIGRPALPANQSTSFK